VTCRSAWLAPTLAAVSTHAEGLSAPLAPTTTPHDPAPGPAPAPAVEPVRPAADRFMRRLLRIHGAAEPGAVFGAQKAMTNSILVSAVRCTITYLLIPILTPILGVLDVLSAPISIVLCTVAVVMSTRSLRRFWKADHSKRWHYTALVVVVWAFLAVAVVKDVAQLL
jgi:hypothetical protein